jgi:hypothetical protein
MKHEMAKEGAPKYSLIFTQSKIYLSKPRGGLANTPWMGDCSSKYYSAHYLDLCARLPKEAKDKRNRWWYKQFSREAVAIAAWLRRMESLTLAHMEKMKREADPDDLAVDNERYACSAEGEAVWEYRV